MEYCAGFLHRWPSEQTPLVPLFSIISYYYEDVTEHYFIFGKMPLMNIYKITLFSSFCRWSCIKQHLPSWMTWNSILKVSITYLLIETSLYLLRISKKATLLATAYLCWNCSSCPTRINSAETKSFYLTHKGSINASHIMEYNTIIHQNSVKKNQND
jgi:hypothetical protein